eukprot:TRINITY_DN69090_c0_g1_i1.p1 TRINITY_DN69090_c0_g1~~TRINITY_DN69090_c0_g1_i1.p1  ORF type:complete len:366 (-),score=58.28 TRINITY_DN69090_c0_g1_i1:21-1118(-)
MDSADAATWSGGPEDGFFEGTEKRIEIDFETTASVLESTAVPQSSLLDVPTESWAEVVKLCQTTILSSKESSGFKSYLLSESSLLVYPDKLIIKTCGRTVPLASVEKVLSLAHGVGKEPVWLVYSRKSFLKPLAQPEEHRDMNAEVSACQRACNGRGDAYILGPLTGDHWLVYNADFIPRDGTSRGDFTIDMMMYGLPEDVRKCFQTTAPEGSREGADEMTRSSGFGAVIASIGGEIDDYSFLPCGYSCNAHANGAYCVTHVTPEESCSYASFETNFGCDFFNTLDTDISGKVNGLVSQVLEVFKPEHLTLTLFTDAGAITALGGAPFCVPAPYMRKNTNTYSFELDYSATVANYARSREQALEQ